MIRIILIGMLCVGARAVAQPAASWSFDGTQPADQTRGFHKSVTGVSGQALQFDGQTTVVSRPAAEAPRLHGAFTVEAWVAIQSYPWTWCAIVDQEREMKSGYLLGIDANGHFGLNLSVGGKWMESHSDDRLPLYKWNHLVGVYDPHRGVALYRNGKPAGTFPAAGPPDWAATQDIWIGRNHTALNLTEEVRVVAPVAFSFDGLIDEVRIYDHALGQSEVESAFRAVHLAAADPLTAPILPSGPKGPGRFGAYYTRLRYTDTWESPWRVGDDADVLIRFEGSANRLVFWRGTSYIPAWVTDNGIWYTNEFWETQAEGMDTSAEPMADKQARFSHVRIIENTDARVVVHWRYAPVSVNYDLVHVDPLTGWGDWIDEYYTVYPDGACVRKITARSSSPFPVPGQGPGATNFRQFHETIIINPPGTRPEDNIKSDALTLVNMQGETHTYSWANEAPGSKPDFDDYTLDLLHKISDIDTSQHKWLMQPKQANIQVVNMKSRYSPFVIVNPKGVAIDCYDGEIIRDRSMFPWWNHWPVSQQIRSNGRWAVAPDRPSHSSLSHIQSWQPVEMTTDSITMVMLNGLTEKNPRGLLPLAKSWLQPAPIQVSGGAFASDGYQQTEKAYVLHRVRDGGALEISLQASASSPIVNPALVIRNWGDAEARLTVNGKPSAVGDSLRFGQVHRLEGTDLVVWMRVESTSTVKIRVTKGSQAK